MTRSPGRTLLTPAPTSFTTPASSLPGENGSGGLSWYLFWMMSTSGKLTPAALTDTTTSPGPATGDGTSSMTREPGGPYCLHNRAFTCWIIGRRRRMVMSDIIRETGARYRNWGRWGADDERGTLNYVTPDAIVRAARLARRGAVFSL